MPLQEQHDKPVTTVTRTFYGCALGAHRLNRIVRVFNKPGATGTILFSTVRNGTTLQAGSLPELLEQVKDSTEPGNPDDMDNVRITTTGVVGRVTFSIDPTCATYTVEGDTIWARGVTQQVKDLLAEAGGRDQPVRGGGRLFAVASFVVCTLLAIIATTAHVIGTNGADLAWAAFFVLCGTLAAGTVGRIRSRRNRCYVSAAGELPPRNWWRAMEVRDRIALAAAAIGLVSLVYDVGHSFF